MKRPMRFGAVLPAAFAAALAFSGLAAPPGRASVLPQRATLAVARSPARLTAMRWAESQAGKWYCWGGTGPFCYDCSGLVISAYQRAGVYLPRTTYGMLRSGRLVRIPASQARPGDLAFYGPGHVELVAQQPGTTFGSLESGTQIGLHRWNPWWHPTMYFRVTPAAPVPAWR